MAKWYVLIISIVIVGGWYAISQYKQSSIEKAGLTVCNQDICEKSIHIHANITASVCGQPVDFKTHRGDTNEQHTHKDDDLMHFHNRLRVDPKTQEIIDSSPLYLNNFFENLGVKLTDTCLADKCNGDLCPNGQSGKMEFIINSTEDSLKSHYPWKDGDTIIIRFE